MIAYIIADTFLVLAIITNIWAVQPLLSNNTEPQVDYNIQYTEVLSLDF